MRPYALLLPIATALLSFWPNSAFGQPQPAAAEEPVADVSTDLPSVARAGGFDPKYVLDRGRLEPPPTDPDRMSFSLHAEWQVRFRANNELPLQPAIGAPSDRTLESNTLGQRYYLYQWLRLRPLFQFRKRFKLVGEIDLPRGMVLGENTQQVGAARDALSEIRFWDVHPRKLYLDYQTPYGLFRLGHQTSHWGMGLLANDGDHPTLFGDYRRGSIVERAMFVTKPMGADKPLQLAFAGDVVFEDQQADLIDGDLAMQLVGALRWVEPCFSLGAYAVYRHQETKLEAVMGNPFKEELDVGVLDLAATFNAPIPGVGGYVFGEAEALMVAGSTTYLRSIEQLQNGTTEDVLSFGAAAKVGAVRLAHDADGAYGDLTAALEWGYASGDADPYDGVTRRFTFDENRNVGLVLFDHVLAWKTARAATIAQDPNVSNRPAPGLRFLPSEGGVFGATYLHPTVVVRPLRQLDLKAGVVLAQTTADMVDPFHAGALGSAANYDGGDPKKHSLGIEFDAGIDGRIPVTDSMLLQLGAEGGLLLPGSAFDDANGNALPLQYLLNTRFGLQI